MRRILGILTLAALLCLSAVALMMQGGCDKHSAGPVGPPETRTVHGTLYGVATMTRDSLSAGAQASLDSMLGQWTQVGPSRTIIRLVNNGAAYEFRRTYPVDSLTVTIGGQPAMLHPDGTFHADHVPIGSQEMVFSIRGKRVRLESVRIDESFSPMVDFDIVYPSTPCHHGMEKTLSIPCLRSNGVGPGGFLFSDCWMSLFYGPPWYSWMCWSEAMDRFFSISNIWCNGSQNCSLFVHGWDWNKQFWHKHSFFWIARW